MAAADLRAVRDIFGWYAIHTVATFEEAPRSAADWSGLATDLDRLHLPFLVADDDGVIAGYAYAGPWRRKSAYRATAEDSIFVTPGHTGQGIGRRLLTDLLTTSAAAGVRQMIAVIADADAAASIALHTSCAFVPAGRLTNVGYKHGQWVDTILMQRAIG
jgi:phosphinothricin acetyltransferase